MVDFDLGQRLLQVLDSVLCVLGPFQVKRSFALSVRPLTVPAIDGLAARLPRPKTSEVKDREHREVSFSSLRFA